MDARILAAVMPAPRQPVEIREFPRPDLPPRSALLRDRARRSVRHRRAPVARPARRRAVSDHSRARVGGHARRRSAAARRPRRHQRCVEGDRAVFFDVHRTCGRCRACTVHRTPTRCPARDGSTASPIRPPKGCSADGRRRSISSPASAWRGCRTRSRSTTTSARGCGLLTAVHILERAALRPADTRARAGRRRRRAERDCARPARRRVGRSRDWRAAVAPRSGPADGRGPRLRPGCDHAGASVWQDVRAHTHGEGVDVVIEAAGSARAFEEGLELVRDGGRYVIAGHYTDVGPSIDQRAPAHQPQASRDSRLLGQRAGPFPARARDARAARRRRAVARDRPARLPVDRSERRARRRRGDANHQGSGRSMGVARPQSAMTLARL